MKRRDQIIPNHQSLEPSLTEPLNRVDFLQFFWGSCHFQPGYPAGKVRSDREKSFPLEAQIKTPRALQLTCTERERERESERERETETHSDTCIQ